MAHAEQEIEAKFFIHDLPALATRLQTLGIPITSPRVLETNLRFDTPDGSISRERKALRLRLDSAAFLTFKGPNQNEEGISTRQEIEFQVSDFETARHFLEALGYQVSIIYQKYRTTYQMGDLMITLDELPMGNFMEIEGPDAGEIEEAAKLLELNWRVRSNASYLALFYQFRAARGLTAQNLTFEEVSGVTASPHDINLQYADLS